MDRGGMIRRLKIRSWVKFRKLKSRAEYSAKPKADNPYYAGPVSDHFDGRLFFNPNGVPPGRLTDLLKWKMLEKPAKWPAEFISHYDNCVPEMRVEGSRIIATLIGHAAFLIQTEGLNIVTDPVFSDRASPFQIAGPKRINPPGIRMENLPPIDVVLLTHNHYDHMDLLSLARLVEDHDPLIITPLGNDTIIMKSIPTARIQIGDWGDFAQIGKGVKVHFEPCHHWSARGTKDRRMALWSAFVIETPHRKIYHIGDTGFHNGINYKAAAEKHVAFDLVIIPIGAYEPRWFMKGQHQNPQEAVEGFRLCKAKHALGHHWGTFQLTNEPIEEPPQKLAAVLKEMGIELERFRALVPGEQWDSELV